MSTCATYVQVSTLMRPLYSFEDLYESLTQDIVDMEAMFDLLEQAPAVQVSGLWRQSTCKLCRCFCCCSPYLCCLLFGVLRCSGHGIIHWPQVFGSPWWSQSFLRTFHPLSCRIGRVPGTLWYLREQSHARAWHLDTRLAPSS